MFSTYMQCTHWIFHNLENQILRKLQNIKQLYRIIEFLNYMYSKVNIHDCEIQFIGYTLTKCYSDLVLNCIGNTTLRLFNNKTHR